MILISIIVCALKVFCLRFLGGQSRSCTTKILYWIVDILCRMLIFGYFIRNSLEISQFILISSLNEIYYFNISDSYRLFSFLFSILIILLFILMVGLILYLTLSSYKINKNEHNKLEEFFRGLKLDKKHKIYTTVLLTRRFIFVVLLMTCVFILSRILVILLSIIQTLYIVYISYLRPYEESKGNLIEILNEIYFGFLILFLSIINSEDEWNSVKTNLYTGVIVSNTFVIFIIVCVYFIKEVVKGIKNKCCGNRTNNDEVIKIAPKETQHNDRNEICSNTNNNKLSQVNPGYIVSNQFSEESKSISNLNILEMNSRVEIIEELPK